MGVYGHLFEVAVNKSLDFRSFKISTTTDKIYIDAYDGISAAKGFHHYIKYYMNRSIYWNNDRVCFANIKIHSNLTITSKSESYFIYYQNVCTWGYSFVWWNWSQWIKHIDWMAMMGISLSIAPLQEQLWYETYSEIGLTDDEISSYFSGPAFLPWLKTVLSIKDMVPNKVYIIDGAYRTTTKYGESIVLQLDEGLLYLPKRFNYLESNAQMEIKMNQLIN